MTYAIAAAGTGGHVFPALAVAEALVDLGVAPANVVFLGGTRFEAEAVPAAGFELVSLPLRGLQRRITIDNFKIPGAVASARAQARQVIRAREVGVILAAGGYATVPVALAARAEGVPYFVQEQNAHAGLANRLMARGAVQAFTSFPDTEGLKSGTPVGNPVRRHLSSFSRPDLRAAALERYGFLPDRVTMGVVGGSLGATVLNEAVVRLVSQWAGPNIQIVHLVGTRNAEEYEERASQIDIPPSVRWAVVPFEAEMQYFFAAIDFALARAGGMVAELTATATPSILVPGGFGSKGHQDASASYLVRNSAAVAVDEADPGGIVAAVEALAGDPDRRRAMSEASSRIGHPEAARVIAEALVSCHD